jgi:hypothetical protein
LPAPLPVSTKSCSTLRAPRARGNLPEAPDAPRTAKGPRPWPPLQTILSPG